LAVRAGADALYVAEKGGRVFALRQAFVDPTPVLDLSGQVSGGGEQGLLGLAFSPDGGYLYVNYTDVEGNTHVTEFAMTGGRADASTRRDVLVGHQPFSNHNGGDLVFGPDGFLYIGLGDGGSGGDPEGNGQALGTLLAKMLRINPRPSGGRPYGIPPDNPFVGRSGARPEIWAYGLRNPWRYSFDRATRDLWIADVGQNAWEEIDFEPAGSKGGRNYGWNLFEGNHTYAGVGSTAATVRPIYEYGHDVGQTIIGGYVYRGSRIPSLDGAYLFVDFYAGRLMALRESGGRVLQVRALGPHIDSVASFGEDQDGELYLLSLGGGVYRLEPGS
jgi:glucose/arabinose dehydrogenase